MSSAVTFDIREVDSVEFANAEPLIKINTGKKDLKTQFYDESFNEWYWDKIIQKLDAKEYDTVPSNHLSALNCLNGLYLDIDYYVKGDIEEIKDNNTEIMEMYLNVVRECLMYEPIHVFKFLPRTFLKDDVKGFKCGAHVFMYFSQNINREERDIIISRIHTKILGDKDLLEEFAEYGLDINNGNIGDIFDSSPIKTLQMLLPFAEKVGAQRRYYLHNPEDIDASSGMLVKPTIQSQSVQNDESMNDIRKSLDAMQAFNMSQVQYINSKITKETISFIESMKYFTANHIIWKFLSQHDLRLRKIIMPVFHWLMLSEFVFNPKQVGTSLQYVTELLADRIVKLVNMTNGPDDKPNTKESLYQDIIAMCWKPYQDQEGKSPYVYLIDPDLAEAACVLKNQSDTTKVMDAMKKYLQMVYAGEALDKNDVMRQARRYTKQVERIRKIAKDSIFPRFSKFIKRIMDNFTTEIEPFITKDDFKITENVRMGELFDDYITFEKGIKQKNYKRVIECWLRMFICIMYYNKRDTFDSIRESISALTSNYVFLESEGSQTSYIYNIRQTRTLRECPFNQWIMDENSNFLNNWFAMIYAKYIDRQLQTEEKTSFINSFIDLLRIIRPFEVTPKEDIIPLTNFKHDIDKLKDNVLTSSEHRIKIKPIKEPVCEGSSVFPMRNGWLEFVTPKNLHANNDFFVRLGLKVGDYYFSRNNFGRYMDAYTNVYYNENYSFKNSIYQIVSQIPKQIYAKNPDTGDYAMMIISQALHSYGGRDQIVQFYGTGAEGKSLINFMTGWTVGCGNHIKVSCRFTKGYNYQLGQKDENQYNPFGLSVTLSPEALIRASKATHQSGGTVELAFKRFAFVEEPDTETHGSNMNVSTGKRITGGSTFSARKLFKEPITFIPKTIITIQVNSVLGYSEDGDAIQRRYSVIPHHSKFVTKALIQKNSNFGKDLKHRTVEYEADPTLNDTFASDPAYWEAWFWVMLPYAQRFIREEYPALSSIEKPPEVLKALDESRLNSVGAIGWIAQHIVEVEHSLISVRDILDHILSADRNERSTNGGILDESMRHKNRESLERKLGDLITSRFAPSWLFKLRNEFWCGGKVQNNATVKNKDGEEIDLNINDLNEINNDDDIDLWFNPEPLRSLFGIHDYNGVYVIYHNFQP